MTITCGCNSASCCSPKPRPLGTTKRSHGCAGCSTRCARNCCNIRPLVVPSSGIAGIDPRPGDECGLARSWSGAGSHAGSKQALTGGEGYRHGGNPQTIHQGLSAAPEEVRMVKRYTPAEEPGAELGSPSGEEGDLIVAGDNAELDDIPPWATFMLGDDGHTVAACDLAARPEDDSGAGSDVA